MAGWPIDSQEFSQVVRSSRVEAIITEMRVCTVSMNQWATNEEKMRRNVVSFRNSKQGEQRCSEPSVVCLGDTEDIQKEKSCNNQDVKEKKAETRVFVASVDRR